MKEKQKAKGRYKLLPKLQNEKTEKKTCTICHADKLLYEFAKDSRSSDGRRQVCKDCVNERQKQQHHAKRSEQRLYPNAF